MALLPSGLKPAFFQAPDGMAQGTPQSYAPSKYYLRNEL
jgi:hypothetical protein